MIQERERIAVYNRRYEFCGYIWRVIDYQCTSVHTEVVRVVRHRGKRFVVKGGKINLAFPLPTRSEIVARLKKERGY